ncbi:MAG TPA: hypothetical protein PKW05_08395 [Anaerolineae bacterium]|nr:hypothetical protein [Anaerolineae bacterium]HQJ51780.1 hypothetical protein [Anaerolineae bacterium]
MRRRRLIGLLLIALLCLPLTACESMSGSDYMLLMELIYGDWGNAKGTNPRNDKGEIDPVKAAGAAVQTGKQELLGTGNEDADAALSAVGITGEVRPWDGQVSDAVNKGDESSILLAITDYPNDPHYYNALAVVQLAKGNGIDAMKNFEQAKTLSKGAKKGQSDAVTAADKMQTRDILPLLEQAIQHQSENGATDAGKTSLLSTYCSGVRHMQDKYSDSYWSSRAKTKMNLDCEQYR